MIKEIKVKGVHGIESDIKFGSKTIIQGDSKIGKTTILNSIMACYSGYFPGYGKSLPEGSVELKTDSGDIIINSKKIVSNIQLDNNKTDLIRYIVPGNFFRLTKGTPEQREIITKLIGLDTYILEKLTTDIKDIKSKIKEFDTKKEQITLDVIRLEDDLELYSNIEQPVKPDIKGDNSQEILDAYNKHIEEINKQNRKAQAEYNLLLEDYQRDLYTANNYRSNEMKQLSADIFNMNNELDDIKSKADKLKSTEPHNCSECGTLIEPKDNTKEIEVLRLKYKSVKDTIDTYEIQLTKIQEEKNLELSKLVQPTNPKLVEFPNCNSLLEKSEVVGIKYHEGDKSILEKYNEDNLNYIQSVAKKETIEKEIEVKSNQLKELNPTELETNLKRKEKEKSEFNKLVEDKIKETGLDIRLFETLKNGNIKETFEIYDEEGFNYNATSTGNQIYIEILIAKLFVDYLDLDFILVDKWESVGPNLRDKVFNTIGDLQFIATEVTKGNKIKATILK